MNGPSPTRVYSHDKGIMVEVVKNQELEPDIISVGDSSTDLSMMIPVLVHRIQSRQTESKHAFEDAGVPVVIVDLRDIWEHISKVNRLFIQAKGIDAVAGCAD